ncbi:MAG: sel1 repeat family protein [bacterium]|nr:sel1 repeat family protein [bacterium]
MDRIPRFRLIAPLVAIAVLAVGCGDRFEAGNEAYKAEDFTAAMELWKPLAEAGHPMAQSYVGLMYRKGEGVEPDPAEAVRWFQASADQGNPKGQFNLGVSYYQGEGVDQDLVQALKWFILADAQSVPGAADGRTRCTDELTPQQVAEAERLAAEFSPES